MEKKERLNELIASDVFQVANMATHCNIKVSEDMKDFMMDWFSKDRNELINYSFDELKEFAKEALSLLDINKDIEKEPMLRLSIKNLRNLGEKTLEEMLIEREESINLWNDSEGEISNFIKKHGNSEEFKEAQNVITSLLFH